MTGRERDHREAARIAAIVGAQLLAVRADPELHGADLRAAGDRIAHERLVAELAAAFPDDAVLSEEAADDASRLGCDRVWIVDPLDGTREFGEAGRPDWAVHVALVVGGRAEVGAVALPARGIVLSTADPPVVPTAEGRAPQIVVSRTRPPGVAGRVRDGLAGELVPLGSAGAKTAAVLLGDADVYVHAGGQHEWDSAAPVAVALAAGLHASRLDGSPLRYNQPDPYVADLLVCRPELAPAVLAAVSARADA